MPKVKCKFCSVLIEREDAYRTALQSFCNVEHYKKHSKKAAKKRRPSIDPEWEKIRKEVIQLDGGRCRACGTKRFLNVHHIVYRSEQGGNGYKNLITLCRTHHDLVHTDKMYYQPECQRVAVSRGVYFTSLKIKPENNEH
jgi:5-methylcytosine-specific restriction endonuclease McrA